MLEAALPRNHGVHHLSFRLALLTVVVVPPVSPPPGLWKQATGALTICAVGSFKRANAEFKHADLGVGSC